MPDASVSIELHDDVAWETHGTPKERLQLKHHLRGAASITDKSDDLWRTVRVWLDDASPTDPDGAVLMLVTTASAPDDSGVYCLRPETLNLAEGQRLIEAAARESNAAGTEKTRQRFLALGPADRQAFVSRIRVLDGSLHIIDVEAEVRRSLAWALPRAHEDMFLELLWGWWDREALGMLQGTRGPMGVGELQDQVTEIRDQFTNDRLPTLLHLSDVDPSVVEAMLGNRMFVAQLRLIDWPEQNLQRAIIDYHRAFVHTTRWVDDDLIGLPDLLNFGVELVDEWKSEFEFMRTSLDPQASEIELKQAGVDLLRKLLESTAIRVRPRYDDRFFARGKRHELADTLQVGWHPNFEARLRGMPEP
jgi:hypothetical protein